MKILLLDNYDSFTYNLAQMLKESLMCEFEIIKNDNIDLSEVKNYDKILLSPGPGLPNEAGKMYEIIKKYYDRIPILGICLGMQGIGEIFGAKLYNLQNVFHGQKEKVKIDTDELIFSGLEKEIEVGLYHSWALSPDNLPKDLKITGISENKVIMAISHKNGICKGVQFHPESYITKDGKKIIENWIKFL